MKKFLLLGLMLVVSIQLACTRGTDSTEAGGEAALTDDQLEQQIDDRFQADTTMNDTNLDVDVDRGMITLSGTVNSADQKDRAMEIVRELHPNATMNDRITVEPGEVSRTEYTEDLAREQRRKATDWGDNIGDSLDDAWIHAKITTKLVGDTDTAARRINVDVERNVVTLRGTVETAMEKEEAERLAKETDGVTRVNNLLKVGKIS
jgi:osmotically-inducible protein OsmY